MRVLIVAPQVPWPPHQGTTIRNFNIARHVAARHSVTLLAFGDPAAAIGPLRDFGIEVLAVPPPPPRPLTTRFVDLFTTATPDLARRLSSPAMDVAIARLAAREVPGSAPFPAHRDPMPTAPASSAPPSFDSSPFDIVQIEGLEMAAHGLAVHAALCSPRTGAGRPRLIYDGHNAEWVLQARARTADLRRPRGWPGAAYSVLQTWKLRRFERRLLAAADAVVAVSAADADALHALAPGSAARIAIVPNGVDTAFYTPADPGAVEPELCVFTGKMDFRPNIDAMAWFCGEVWPLIRARRPAARLAIVGRDPAARVRALADEAQGIAVTGAVADTRPWIGRAGVVVVPLRVGGGTRLKVLEAMAMAKAVAATSLGVEGLALAAGEEILVGDTPPALAAAVVQLIEDADLRRRLGARSRGRAVADYRWEVLVGAIEALYTG